MGHRQGAAGISRMLFHVGITFCIAATAVIRAQPSSGGSGTVSGYVYCSDTNGPARFAVVKVQAVASLGATGTSPNHARVSGQTMTDLGGHFTVSGLAPGKYVVMATLPGYTFPLAQYTWRDLTTDAVVTSEDLRARVTKVLPTVAIEADKTSGFSIVLDRGAEISGSVSYDDGSPVIGVKINLYRKSVSGHDWDQVQLPSDSWGSANTNDRGGFRIVGLPAGQYLVAVRIPPPLESLTGIAGGQIETSVDSGYPGKLETYYGDTFRRSAAKVISVSPGEQRTGVDLEFKLGALHTVSGTVSAQSDGHRLKGGRMEFQFSEDHSTLLVAHWTSDGSFSIPFVPDGNYLLQVSAAPETDGNAARTYKPLSLPLNIRGDLNDLNLLLAEE